MIFNNLNSMVEEQKRIYKEFQERGKRELKNGFKEFFKRVPEVKTVHWVQYTPYFNDGDPCVFRVCDASFSNVEDVSRLSCYEDIEDEQEGEFNTEVYGSYKNMLQYGGKKILSEDSYNICKELNVILTSSEMEDVMENLFGDHVRVIATAEGFDTEDYDHD
jgi:hypothetical protein